MALSLRARTDDLVARYRRHVSQGRAALGQMMGARVETASSGCVVYDADGDALLDCGGYGVFLLGHRHPTVLAAVTRQLELHPLATKVLLEPSLADAAEALSTVAPPGLDYVHFVSSGAEAVETAIKLARTHGKRRLIAMEGGYHGKTMGALSVTGRDLFRRPFTPLLPDVRHVPFADTGSLAALLDEEPDSCVIVEPVQAEGGVQVPPPGYLSSVEDLCRDAGAFLVVDEIQTGLGRLGAWWGSERERVIPDVLLSGKALSGGVVPVAAAIASEEAYATMSRDPFLHTSTFSGAPLAMAAAEAAVIAIAREHLVERSRRLGERLLQSVDSLLGATCGHLVTEVRGVGLLIGVEFASELLAGDFFLELLEQRVIASHSLNAQHVVRLTPPGVLGEEEVRWLELAVERAGERLADRHLAHGGGNGLLRTSRSRRFSPAVRPRPSTQRSATSSGTPASRVRFGA